MSYTESWLVNTSARRCVLAKVARYNIGTTSEEFVYLSTFGYMTDTSDVTFLPLSLPRTSYQMQKDWHPFRNVLVKKCLA